VLTGGDGADWLEGGAGADTMVGGAGNDTFIIDNSLDRVTENAGEGYDAVYTSASFDMPFNIEVVTIIGTAAVTITGNSLDNLLRGNEAVNTLRGGAGADNLMGFGGDDVLYGGQDNDVMAGGAGADTFLYVGINDSMAYRPDLITDFDPLADRIDLSQIDANAALAGDQAFSWVSGFTGQAGQALLTYDATANRTTLALDANGDGVAEFKVEIAGHITTGDGGFIL
jgi:Ca2+-binding RTX toxin-like protein